MGGSQSRAVSCSESKASRSKKVISETVVQETASDEPAEDTDADSYEVVLRRTDVEAWGFAWNVGAHAAQRLIVAGIDPASPAGRWNCEQEAKGLRGISRKDELVEVNGVSSHEKMRRELVGTGLARMLFRRHPEVETEAAAAALAEAAASLAKQRRAARERAAAPDLPLPIAVKNTFIHVNSDEEGARPCLGPRGQLSSSDPLPLRGKGDHLRALSPASSSSFRSCESTLSRASSVGGATSGEQRSIPSTDWEFAAYHHQKGQLPAESPPSASSSSSQGKRRRRIVNQQAPLPPIVPVLVPVIGVEPGGHFITMSPIAPGTAIPVQLGCGPILPGGQALPCNPVTTSGSYIGQPQTPLDPQDKAETGPVKVSEPAVSPEGVPASPRWSDYQDEVQAACSEVQTTATGEIALEPKEHKEEASQRKKPTRRGGKRARHRPCHVAAAAMEYMSGSIETPSFGDPGSGEEAEGEASGAEMPELRQGTSCRAKEAPKPRSFYPLAARLRVASSGREPVGESQEGGKAIVAAPTKSALTALDASSSKTRAEEIAEKFARLSLSMDKEREELRACKEADDFLLEADVCKAGEAEELFTLAEAEVESEVEPEPASAVDSEERDRQKSNSPSLDQASTPLSALLADAVELGLAAPIAKEPETAFAVAKSPELASHDRHAVPKGEVIVGRRVFVNGLKRTPEFNGQWGKVEAYDSELGRYLVQLLPLTGPPVLAKLRRENLHTPPALLLRFAGEDGPKAVVQPQGETKQLSEPSKATWRPSLRPLTGD